MKINFLFILFLITYSSCYAASFDCEKANSSDEKMICSDYKLSRFDDFLSENYRIAMSSVMPDKIKNEIKESQIQWLSKRNECTDFQCIKDMYIRRIEYIRFRCFEHIPGKSGCISYSDAIERIDKEEYTQTHKSSAEVVKDLFVKHASQVHQLGFNGNQLKYGVFIELGNYVKYCTLEEYLSLMFELPGFKSLEKLDYKDYVGFKIKISGQPYSGFIFREEGDEFYLVGLVSGNEIIEAVTVGDTRRLSSIFMSYANHVINNNNVKH